MCIHWKYATFPAKNAAPPCWETLEFEETQVIKMMHCSVQRCSIAVEKCMVSLVNTFLKHAFYFRIKMHTFLQERQAHWLHPFSHVIQLVPQKSHPSVGTPFHLTMHYPFSMLHAFEKVTLHISRTPCHSHALFRSSMQRITTLEDIVIFQTVHLKHEWQSRMRSSCLKSPKVH